jgi:aromatic-L-amino-acid/L-tryptophan decarboxylase
VSDPALPDRAAMLELAAQEIIRAWDSFDRPRPRESVIDEDLATRLIDPLPEEPGDPAAAMRDAARVLDASISPARPLYLAYIGSTGLATGALASALASTYDVNLAAHAAAGEFIDGQALRWTAEFVGYPHADGAFTSGGQVSNLTALVAAREQALPGSRQRGLEGRSGAVYCSREAHHSVIRAAEIAGLGTAAVRGIDVDADRRMDPDLVNAAIAADRDAGVTPVAIVATAGTTLTGAVDDLAALADVAEQHGVWLHVDGAYGLPAARTPSAAALFRGLERADSVTLDAHKWLGVPKSCSVLLVRDGACLLAAFGHRESYMLHRGDAHNPVDRTLEYSRPFSSLKLWMAFRVHGAAALRRWIERSIGHARRLATILDADPEFEVLHRPQLSALCFQHRPPGVDGVDEHNLRLAHAIQADGRVYLAPADLDGRICLRVCFVNFRTTDDEVDDALEVIRELGHHLPLQEVAP